MYIYIYIHMSATEVLPPGPRPRRHLPHGLPRGECLPPSLSLYIYIYTLISICINKSINTYIDITINS